MFTTPIPYSDDPKKAVKFLEDLNEHDTYHYAIGYVQACDHVSETLTDMKSKYYMMIIDNNDLDLKSKVLSITRSLDTLDTAIRERSAVIREEILKSPLSP